MPDANHPLNAAALLLGRLLLASLFIIDGWGKIGSYAAAVGYMESFGIPGALLPLVILTEVGCGLCIALGWQARLAALACREFQMAHLPFRSLIVHEDFESGLSRKDQARITNAADKQFASLADFQAGAEEYFAREAEATVQ